MTASTASYAALGLAPGAERSTIDAAYRALMKRYHPDLGGDPAKAAEINRAYAEITRPGAPARAPESTGDLAAALYARRAAVPVAASLPQRRSRRFSWAGFILLVGAIGWTAREPLTDLAWKLRWQFFQPVASDAGGLVSPGDAASDVPVAKAPIAKTVIDQAIAEARAALARGGVARAAEVSRVCFQRFVDTPAIAAYDHCVGFDQAVLVLVRSANLDHGMFSAAALTKRQLNAGRRLDADYDTIEDRLDQLRLRVVRELSPGDAAAAAPIRP